MTSSIVEFWRQTNDAIHPADAKVLSLIPDLFDLNYPPPAYVGDIENAPIILLNGNGGYKASVTPLEFPDKASKDRAIDRLHNPAPIEDDVCSYYADGSYSRWLKSGELAMVNAVAYRAPNITKDVARIARKLPSTQVHIQWLKQEVMPAAKAGKRFIVAHRNRLWNLDRGEASPWMYFTSNPVSERLSRETLGLIEEFLTNRA